MSPLPPGDDVFATVYPQKGYKYRFQIPPDHFGGTFWYHPHLHGSTALHVGSGQAGAIIVRDDPASVPPTLAAMDDVVLLLQCFWSDRKPAFELPGSQRVYIKTATANMFTDNTAMNALSDSLLDRAAHGSGHTFMVNGQLMPTIQMRPGEWQRWRLLHTAVGFNLQLEMGACEMRLIATDGAYIPSGGPIPTRRLTFAPASRRDVIVRCPAGRHTLTTTKGGLFPTMENLYPPNGEQVILRVDSSGELVAMDAPTTLPALPGYMADLRGAEVKGRFTIDFRAKLVITQPAARNTVVVVVTLVLLLCLCLCPFSHTDSVATISRARRRAPLERSTSLMHGEIGLKGDLGPKASPRTPEGARGRRRCVAGMCSCALCIPLLAVLGFQLVTFRDEVNGEVYSGPDRVLHTMRLGAVEEWTITQDSTLPHPLHIHVNHFQLVQVPRHNTFGFQAGLWYDTALMPLAIRGGGDYKIRFLPANYTGPVVVHCHISGHADSGMMMVAQVDP